MLDKLDNAILRLLAENGRMAIGDMVSRLAVTAPTVRTRIKSLEKAGLLKVSGLINPDKHPELITALIGLNIRSHGRLDEIVDKVSRLENVTWAAVVTGRYDVLAEVVFSGGMDDLYHFTTQIIPAVGTVERSETFVILKSKRKWLSPPKGLDDI
jgi:Lrp/AsnC family transcriptional regulator for asnA, asnC and gidA